MYFRFLKRVQVKGFQGLGPTSSSVLPGPQVPSGAVKPKGVSSAAPEAAAGVPAAQSMIMPAASVAAAPRPPWGPGVPGAQEWQAPSASF